MKKRVSLIAAVSENNVIGKDNDLCWYLPKDLKYFKEKTEGHAVIMGRKNWDSIPAKYRPFKNRLNIVVSRNPEIKIDGAVTVRSPNEALEYAFNHGDDEPFIIGGGQMYKAVLEDDLVDRMYITRVHAQVEGDTFFPDYNESRWKLTAEEKVEKDHRHPYDFTFLVYDRAGDR